VVGVSLTTDVYARGRRVHTLTVCPCGYSFDLNENRWKHYLEDHNPEDFGLSPLRKSPDHLDRTLTGGVQR
jgi:hypothetical protein